MMRLSGFSKLAASAKNAMTSRNAAAILANLQTIDAGVQKLTQIVNEYTGGLLAATSISSQQAALGIDIKNAIADAKAAETSNSAESEEALKFIEGNLEPHIQACMVALKNKKTELASASLQGTVHGDLKDMREQTNQLGGTLVSKAPTDKRAKGEELNKKIDADFDDAVRFFA